MDRGEVEGDKGEQEARADGNNSAETRETERDDEMRGAAEERVEEELRHTSLVFIWTAGSLPLG